MQKLYAMALFTTGIALVALPYFAAAGYINLPLYDPEARPIGYVLRLYRAQGEVTFIGGVIMLVGTAMYLTGAMKAALAFEKP